ncbi:lipopolysaccharide assembly protein LapB [Nostoc sp. 2RC]|uniref:tetratricopeptide repeat protein n=1 Tax=Nostoc sp. 2RC TaxID=2485484 RepID=UPI001623D737|nr:hypothetical protein [Nostoc sp. 2RC]MBC1238059.1 hypothetical protein [Nostoc sp. 2RC]
MMIALLCRPQERVFPLISANIYNLSSEETELTADQQAGKNLLQLANQDFSTWHNFTGLGLDLKGQLGHLLVQHKLAIEAEIAAKWQRADFFWNQMRIELKALLKKPELWQEFVQNITNIPGVHIINDPEKIRQYLVNELFINTHCAFYNGLIINTRKPSWKERAFVHIDYIQQLLDLSPVSAQEVETLLGEAWQTRITAYKEDKKWRQAINYCQQRIKWLPNNITFQGELAEIHYLKVLAKLGEARTDNQYTKNAKHLLNGIQTLEKYLKDYPYNVTIFEMLGSLYYLRAISLANNNSLALALLCIQKAVTYNPYLQKAFESRNELIETMGQLQEQVNQLQVDIRQGAQLTPKGQKMVAEANKGFALMNVYIDSDEAKETANDFYIAEAVYLWHKIGLPEPLEGWQKESFTGVMHTANGKTIPIGSNSGWIGKALHLWDAVKNVLQNPPSSKASLAGLWQWAILDKPDLAELDANVICAFLERKLFEEKSDRVLITPPTENSESPPILTPAYTKPQFSTEPMISWLFSSQDKRIKLQMIVASLLIVATSYVVIQERTTFAKREKAYQVILAAKQVQNDQAVLAASKEFFHNASFFGRDERTAQVIEIYEESLVRWVPQQPEAELTSENKEYLKLYTQLQKL